MIDADVVTSKLKEQEDAGCVSVNEISTR